MRRTFLIATFSDGDRLVKAVETVRSYNFSIYDVYSPYPVHGLDQAMGLRRTRLPWVTLIVGALGTTLALSFQFYTSVLDWPLNVGGKPDNSTLAWVPICFELTVLLGGLSIFFALLVRARLYPGKKEQLAAEGVTNDTFALVLRKKDSAFDMKYARELLEQSGANEVKVREAEL